MKHLYYSTFLSRKIGRILEAIKALNSCLESEDAKISFYQRQIAKSKKKKLRLNRNIEKLKIDIKANNAKVAVSKKYAFVPSVERKELSTSSHAKKSKNGDTGISDKKYESWLLDLTKKRLASILYDHTSFKFTDLMSKRYSRRDLVDMVLDYGIKSAKYNGDS